MAVHGPTSPSVSGGKAPGPDQTRAPLLPRKGRSPLPLDVASAGMVVRALRVRAVDVVFVKGLLEASDGLAAVFAERGGELTIVAPEGRDAELEELLADLVIELGAVVDPARRLPGSGRERRSDRCTDRNAAVGRANEGSERAHAGRFRPHARDRPAHPRRMA